MGSLGTRERVVKPFTHQPSTAIKRLSRQNSRAHQLAKIRTDQTSREGIGIDFTTFGYILPPPKSKIHGLRLAAHLVLSDLLSTSR